MKKEIRKLPDAELAVMQAIWSCGERAERAMIAEKLRSERPMAETTLLTLLTRLHEKEFIKIEKAGRRSVYSPLVGQHEYISAQSRRFVDTICGGSISAFASALCDSALTREELDELRELLERGAL